MDNGFKLLNPGRHLAQITCRGGINAPSWPKLLTRTPEGSVNGKCMDHAIVPQVDMDKYSSVALDLVVGVE
jgi:hypothetical protein